MLTELRVTNFAVLEQLTLTFSSGFTVLTGETGAGKSLLIDAIGLLVGGRASGDQIRFGAEEAQLEAAFDLPSHHPVRHVLRERGILRPDESQLIIRRVIARSGRNRVYLNGVLSPAHVLDELGGTLVDIHGQHDQQSLLSPSMQLDVLDGFGGLGDLRRLYRQRYEAWEQSRRRRAELVTQIEQTRRLEELLHFQHQELAEAALQPGEDEALEAERRRLGSSRRLGDLSAEALELLRADPDGIMARMGAVVRVLGEVVQLDPQCDEIRRLTSEARVWLKEATEQLRAYAERLDGDPERLAAVEDRLETIRRMKKKYGGSIEAALDTQHRVAEALEQMERADQALADCERSVAAQETAVAETGHELSKKRKEAAKRLAKAVRRELDALKMGHTQLSIEVSAAEGGEVWGPDGGDRVAFLLSTNAGEPLRPMARIASGGELSRVMLALKSVVADADRVPVLIFDEIDTGVGGAVAAAVGKRLRALGRFHQVFCVTHLPQVASQAEHHLCVEKVRVKERTMTTVRLLQGMQRESEIARMLGGETVTRTVRATAAELLAGSGD